MAVLRWGGSEKARLDLGRREGGAAAGSCAVLDVSGDEDGMTRCWEAEVPRQLSSRDPLRGPTWASSGHPAP